MHRCGRSQRRVMHVTQTIRHPTRCSTLAVNRPSCSVLGTSTLPIDEIPTPRPTSSASSASQCSASAFAPVEALLKGFRSPLTSSYSMMICPGEIPRLGAYHGIESRIGHAHRCYLTNYVLPLAENEKPLGAPTSGATEVKPVHPRCLRVDSLRALWAGVEHSWECPCNPGR